MGHTTMISLTKEMWESIGISKGGKVSTLNYRSKTDWTIPLPKIQIPGGANLIPMTLATSTPMEF
jgi:hypothetical protein